MPAAYYDPELRFIVRRPLSAIVITPGAKGCFRPCSSVLYQREGTNNLLYCTVYALLVRRASSERAETNKVVTFYFNGQKSSVKFSFT